MMKRHIFLYLLQFLGVLSGLLASCTDELVENQSATAVVVDDTNLVETHLSFDVAAMNTLTGQTRTTDDPNDIQSESITEEEKQGTDAERKIDNIWVFQFDATSEELLITPRYYDLSDKNVIPDATNGKEVDVLLKPDVSSIVYVVANIGKVTASGSDWATAHNSATLEDVRKLTLPDPKIVVVGDDGKPDSTLPMEGKTIKVTTTKGQAVSVTLTRMYAKVIVLAGDIPESININSVTASNIPYYCKVGTLEAASLNKPATYPDDVTWTTRDAGLGSKNEDGKYMGKLVLYIPENLQGRTTTTKDNPELKADYAPANAFNLTFLADYVDIFDTDNVKENDRKYIVYPGTNTYNDYNIRRNFIYRVTLNIYTDLYNQDVPSSNCFVVKPNQSISFLPYYRTETGGGYDFTNYLDANGEDDAKKINDSDDMLKNIQIIWQTKDAIGDNSKGDRVWIDRRSEAMDEYHRKIHVKAGTEPGNALIAAYNSKGDIIWSWHIWVTENEPANVSNAVVYSTYAWDENGIYTNIRVPGYAVMPCNLGALRNEPTTDKSEWLDMNPKGTYIDGKTFGMLYQWGRKDPFPPVITSGAYEMPPDGTDGYTDYFTGNHYANDGSNIVGKTNQTDTNDLFHSHKNTYADTKEAIKYAIEHPTVFMIYSGNWLRTNDSMLWGAENRTGKKSLTFTLKTYQSGSEKEPVSTKVTLCDDYGDKKSIFDPCPSGWRVSPMEMWLNFTITGLNPQYNTEINCKDDNGVDNAFLKNSSTGNCPGLYLYVQAWQSGPTLFFPTQGRRTQNGVSYRCGGCGNYNCATENPTNPASYYAFHIHNSYHYFRVIETSSSFCNKSLGSAVRCVRDHK